MPAGAPADDPVLRYALLREASRQAAEDFGWDGLGLSSHGGPQIWIEGLYQGAAELVDGVAGDRPPRRPSKQASAAHFGVGGSSGLFLWSPWSGICTSGTISANGSGGFNVAGRTPISAGTQLDLWAAVHDLALPAAAADRCRRIGRPMPWLSAP